jgi:protein TonB
MIDLASPVPVARPMSLHPPIPQPPAAPPNAAPSQPIAPAVAPPHMPQLQLPQLPALATLPVPAKTQPKAKPKPKPSPERQQARKPAAVQSVATPQPAPQPLPTAPLAPPAPAASQQAAAAQAQREAASQAAVTAMKSSWLGDVVQHIAKFKRKPRSRLMSETTVIVRFDIDRTGRVLSRQLLQSGGDAAIDAEALAWIDRADPLPLPPREVSDAELSRGFRLPLQFTLR